MASVFLGLILLLGIPQPVGVLPEAIALPYSKPANNRAERRFQKKHFK